jgi:hypothetical protein
MAKRNLIAEQGSRNPSVVLRAFAADTDLTLTLDGWLLLEALENAYVTGGKPTLRDSIIALLVMTDTDAVADARRRGRMDALVREATADRKPGDILAAVPRIARAFEDALQPTHDGAEHEKKSSAESAGASP